jgi:hypothetical protein
VSDAAKLLFLGQIVFIGMLLVISTSFSVRRLKIRSVAHSKGLWPVAGLKHDPESAIGLLPAGPIEPETGGVQDRLAGAELRIVQRGSCEPITAEEVVRLSDTGGLRWYALGRWRPGYDDFRSFLQRDPELYGPLLADLRPRGGWGGGLILLSVPVLLVLLVVEYVVVRTTGWI